jgi:Flp pilus assembly pilin Flp
VHQTAKTRLEVRILKKFLKEEESQGAIEYILLAGGIIVAAAVIFAIYSRITRTAGTALENATGEVTEAMRQAITNATANITA